MMIPFRPGAPGRNIVREAAHSGRFSQRSEPTTKDAHMKWETPEAVDFRFGMEITMYVANR